MNDLAQYKVIGSFLVGDGMYCAEYELVEGNVMHLRI